MGDNAKGNVPSSDVTNVITNVPINVHSFVEDVSSRSRAKSPNDTDHRQNTTYQIIGNDGLISSRFKQLEDILPRLYVRIPIEPHVNEGPLVEVFNKVRENTHDAFYNAHKRLAFVMFSSLACKLLQGLNECDEERAHANRAKGTSDSTKHGSEDSIAAASRLLWVKPPGAHHSSNNYMNGVLRGVSFASISGRTHSKNL